MKKQLPPGWKIKEESKELGVWERRAKGKRVVEMVAMKDYHSSYRRGEWYVYAIYENTETADWVTRYVGGGRRDAIKYALTRIADFEDWEKVHAKGR